MNLLEIIYTVGALAIGFIIGMIVEYFIDVLIVREAHEENQRLALENEQLKQEANKRQSKPMQVIEIVDTRIGADVDYSQNW